MSRFKIEIWCSNVAKTMSSADFPLESKYLIHVVFLSKLIGSHEPIEPMIEESMHLYIDLSCLLGSPN